MLLFINIIGFIAIIFLAWFAVRYHYYKNHYFSFIIPSGVIVVEIEKPKMLRRYWIADAFRLESSGDRIPVGYYFGRNNSKKIKKKILSQINLFTKGEEDGLIVSDIFNKNAYNKYEKEFIGIPGENRWVEKIYP